MKTGPFTQLPEGRSVLKNTVYPHAFPWRLLVAVLCAFVCIGCSESAGNNGNLIVANQSNSNNINTMANNNIDIPEPVSSEELRSALKAHLRAQGDKMIPSDQWDGNAWLDHPVGLFVKNNEIHAQDEVCLAMKDVLTPRNEKMTDSSLTTLRGKVKKTTHCKDAVTAMLSASNETEPIIKSN